VSNIRVELQLEDKSFTSGIWRAGQTLKEFKEELKRTDPHFRKMAAAGQDSFLMFKRQEEASASMIKRLRDVSIVAGGVSLAFHALSGASNSTVGNIIRINAEMEKLKYQMAGMSDAADPMAEAAEHVEWLKDLARSTPFALGALSTSFVKLKAAGIDPMNGSLAALTDGLAAFGASDEQLNRVTVALTQMQGKGVLSMEELRQQLGESMPSAMRLMARSMGVSVGELSKMISTGTVESKAALDKWFNEVRLSYDGTGELMMKTFSGQISKIRTAFTDLATSGEMGKAFESLKEQMGTFAEFLGTAEAREFFDMMGQGFQGLISLGSSMVGVLRELKEMLVSYGPLMAGLFGGAVVMSAGRRLMAAISGMRQSYLGMTASATLLKTRLGELHSTAAASAAAAATAISSSASAAAGATMGMRVSQTASAATSVAGAASRALTPLLTIGARFVGMLGPIAFGLGIVAPLVWELGKGVWNWASGAKEAAEETENATDAALRAVRERQAAEEKFLMDSISRQEKEIDNYVASFGKDNAGMLRNLETLWNRLHEMRKRHAGELKGALDANVDDQVQEALTRISEAGRDAGRDYNKKMNDADEQYNRDLADAQNKGQSQRVVQEAYRARIVDLRVERMKKELKLYDDEVISMRAMVAEGRASEGALAKLIERREEFRRQMQEMRPEDLTIETLTAPEDDSKKQERLQRFIDSARDKVQELSAEMNGASGAVAKLVFQINRGDFGNLNDATENMEQMRDLLLESTIAAEALDKILKDTTGAEREIDRIYENLRKENLRMRANIEGVDTDDDLAYFKWMREQGELEGIGETAEETVKKALDTVTQGLDLSISKFQTVGDTLRDKAFGQDSLTQINTVDQALQRLRSTTASINEELLAINFGNMGTPGFTGPGMPNIRTNVDGGILDLIATRESGGDYNATLDNGRWTNGPQNLTQMTLNQVRALQAQMLSNPENRAKYGDGKGSSALGRYQIVGQTLQGLMEEMGLSGNELYDEKMQDAMATRLLARRGANPAGLRQEWAGLNGVSDADIMAAIARSTAGPTRVAAALGGQPVAAPVQGDVVGPETRKVIEDAAATGIARIDDKQSRAEAEDAERRRLEGQDAVVTMGREIAAALEAQENTEGDLEKFGTFGRRVREAEAAGDYEGADPETVEKLIAQADAYDARQKTILDNSRAEKTVTENRKKLEEELADVSQRRADALAKARDPNHVEQSSEMRKLIALEKEQLALVGQIHGVNSEEYKLEQQRLAKQRAALTGAEAAEALVSLARAAEEAETGAIVDARAKRRQEFDERMRELKALRDQAIRDGMNVAEAEKLYARAVAAERLRLREEEKTAMSQQIDNMSRLGDNINEQMSELPQSLSDGIYDYLTGETDNFSSVVDGIRESITRSLTDAASSAILKPFETLLAGDGTEGSGLGGLIQKSIQGMTGFGGAQNGQGGGLFNGLFESLGGVFKSALSGFGSMFSTLFSKTGLFGVKHSGGIVGAGGGGRSANVMSFLGAPKFHTGGIVKGGVTGGPKFRKGLNPSEVPIIAQKGEGVFTREQMKHLGGSVNSSSVNINAPVTVNATGGSQEQNADLARQVAQQSETMFRGLVQQELITQLRPGGMLRR
jgi:tape measure domain-containing protein